MAVESRRKVNPSHPNKKNNKKKISVMVEKSTIDLIGGRKFVYLTKVGLQNNDL